MKHYLSAITTLLLVIIGLQSVHAQTETVITQCDYQHVSKAIETGGNITLDCDRNIQIWADKPLTIMVDTTIKPAEGRSISFEALKGRAFFVSKNVSLTLTNVKLQGNPNAIGGGIENAGGTLTLTHVEFSDNDSLSGAAIHNLPDASTTITDSIFDGNTSSGGGGAIYNDVRGVMSISGTNFLNNHSWSDSNGGAIYNLGALTISSSTFSGNEAQGRFGWGGAIFNSGNGRLSVVNSTFVANVADHSGAAIRNDGQAVAIISFSTFVENSSAVWGGALYIEGGSVNISNSLFMHNADGKTENDCDNHLKLGTIKSDHNLSNAGCGDKAATGVATLSDNGGLTQTVAIASDSNAIDAADGCPKDAVDQRGTARPQGKACDIGAYEFVELTTAATSVGICQVTTTRDIRLRQEPNTASSVLAVVPHNSTFQAIEQVTGWYHIKYGTVDGWVSAEFVTAKGKCSG